MRARRALYPHARDASAAVARAPSPDRPVRPSLPLPLCAAAGAWLAVLAANRLILAVHIGSGVWGLDARAAAAGCALALCAAAAVGLRALPRAWRTRLACAAVGAAAGAAAGTVCLCATLATGSALEGRAASSLTFRVESDPQPSSTGDWHFEAAALGGPLPGRVWVDLPAETVPSGASPSLPAMGELVRVVGRWSALDALDEFDASLLERGVAARLRVMRWEACGFQGGVTGAIRALRGRMLESVDPYAGEARALAAGVVCGMQAALAAFSASDDFSDLGLTHLVAVSGSHLAVVASVAGSLMRRARSRPPVRLAVGAAVLAAYVVFTGLQPSAVRSWVMAALSLGATVAGRRAHALSGVGVAAFAMVLVDPTCAADMGFSLSVLSVFGLTAFSGLACGWVRALAPARLPDWVVEPLAMTCVAQAFTLPVVLPAFGTLAILSPLANVAVGPLVSALLVVGLACVPLSALLPSLAAFALAPCDALAALACLAARFLASAPVSVITVQAPAPVLFGLCAAAAAGVYAVWPAPPSRRAFALVCLAVLCAAAAVFIRWRVFAPARIVVLDVGQGDAIVVQDGPRAVLVDTGPGDAVCAALAREHVVHLDAVVLTHTDSDHAGGLDDLAGRVPVGEVVVARGVADQVRADPDLAAALEDAAGGRIEELDAGDGLNVGGFSLEAVWPRAPVEGGENEDSLVFVARYGGTSGPSALLTGDAESDVVEGLLAAGAVGEVDLLKVGHHGSAASTTPRMMEALDPDVAVASAGEGNRYGHPAPECVEAVRSSGAEFLCTMDCGDVEFRPMGAGFEVRCARGAGA